MTDVIVENNVELAPVELPVVTDGETPEVIFVQGQEDVPAEVEPIE